MSPIDRLLTVNEAAELLRVSVKTIRRKIQSGEIIPVRIGRSVRIQLMELRRFQTAHLDFVRTGPQEAF